MLEGEVHGFLGHPRALIYEPTYPRGLHAREWVHAVLSSLPVSCLEFHVWRARQRALSLPSLTRGLLLERGEFPFFTVFMVPDRSFPSDAFRTCARVKVPAGTVRRGALDGHLRAALGSGLVRRPCGTHVVRERTDGLEGRRMVSQ